MVNSGRSARKRPAILSYYWIFVNSQSKQKNLSIFGEIFFQPTTLTSVLTGVTICARGGECATAENVDNLNLALSAKIYFPFLLQQMSIDPFCDFLRDNRFIAVVTTGSSSGHFGENAMVKVPIAVIPMAGRSQQRSQTKPETSRNEIVRDSRIKRTNILFSPIYYTIGVGLCQALFSKSSESFSIMFTAVGSMVAPKCQPFRTFSLSSTKMDTSQRSRTLSALVAPYWTPWKWSQWKPCSSSHARFASRTRFLYSSLEFLESQVMILISQPSARRSSQTSFSSAISYIGAAVRYGVGFSERRSASQSLTPQRSAIVPSMSKLMERRVVTTWDLM